MYICTHTYIQMHTYLYICIYIYIYTNITHTHTTQMNNDFSQTSDRVKQPNT